jgi:hypothetical protein
MIPVYDRYSYDRKKSVLKFRNTLCWSGAGRGGLRMANENKQQLDSEQMAAWIAELEGRLAPILWESGIGSDVMKPIAAPIVGGMITSTINVLILVPVFFAIMKERALRKGTLIAKSQSWTRTLSERRRVRRKTWRSLHRWARW